MSVLYTDRFVFFIFFIEGCVEIYLLLTVTVATTQMTICKKHIYLTDNIFYKFSLKVIFLNTFAAIVYWRHLLSDVDKPMPLLIPVNMHYY